MARLGCCWDWSSSLSAACSSALPRVRFDRPLAAPQRRQELIEDVTNDLAANTSALFVIGDGSPAAVVGALEPFKGKVYQTTVDAETEAQLQAALDHESKG